jgi:hypothetical protein
MLADQIERYWREQGYPGIRTYVAEAEMRGKQTFFSVRSNITAFGYPPVYRS